MQFRHGVSAAVCVSYAWSPAACGPHIARRRAWPRSLPDPIRRQPQDAGPCKEGPARRDHAGKISNWRSPVVGGGAGSIAAVNPRVPIPESPPLRAPRRPQAVRPPRRCCCQGDPAIGWTEKQSAIRPSPSPAIIPFVIIARYPLLPLALALGGGARAVGGSCSLLRAVRSARAHTHTQSDQIRAERPFNPFSPIRPPGRTIRRNKTTL